MARGRFIIYVHFGITWGVLEYPFVNRYWTLCVVNTNKILYKIIGTIRRGVDSAAEPPDSERSPSGVRADSARSPAAPPESARSPPESARIVLSPFGIHFGGAPPDSERSPAAPPRSPLRDG